MGSRFVAPDALGRVDQAEAQEDAEQLQANAKGLRGGGENQIVQIGEGPNPHVAQKTDGVTDDRSKNKRAVVRRRQAERQHQKKVELALPLESEAEYGVWSHMRMAVSS